VFKNRHEELSCPWRAKHNIKRESLMVKGFTKKGSMELEKMGVFKNRHPGFF